MSDDSKGVTDSLSSVTDGIDRDELLADTEFEGKLDDDDSLSEVIGGRVGEVVGRRVGEQCGVLVGKALFGDVLGDGSENESDEAESSSADEDATTKEGETEAESEVTDDSEEGNET
ncbi:hypothetical protein [Halogranum amylolyticum]|nr:hypothetical protein [Halogranum amylolyticum]